MATTPEPSVHPIADSRLAQIIATADGDDEALLRLLAHEADRVDGYARRLATMRDEVAARLRSNGVPMSRIATYARVSDSYLSRRLRKALGCD